MWNTIKSDKLRGLTKNLSEFAREVVAPSYEDEEDDATNEPDVAGGSDGQQRYERFESLNRSLRESNASLQQKVSSLTSELKLKTEDLDALSGKYKELELRHSQMLSMKESDDSLQLQLQQLKQQLERQAADHQATVDLYESTKQQLKDSQCLYEKQRKELVLHGEKQMRQQKAEYLKQFATIYHAIAGEPPPVGASEDVHAQVDGILHLISGLKCRSFEGDRTAPEDHQVNKGNAEGELEHLRNTVADLRKANEELRTQLSQSQLAQHEYEQEKLKMQQDFQHRVQLLQASQQQQLNAQVQALQQQHAQDKAAGHAELQRCTTELAEHQHKVASLERQVQSLQQQLQGHRGQADMEERYHESQVIISRLTAQLREQTAMASAHQATHQQEAAEWNQKLNKLQKQLTSLQQENNDLRKASNDTSKSLETIEVERQFFREQIREKEQEIKDLQSELHQKEEEIQTHLMAVENLQSVLDMFHQEREAEVQTRLSGVNKEVSALRAQIAAKQQELEQEREAQVMLREQHEKALRFKQKQMDSLEDKVQSLLQTMETQMKRMNDDNVIDKTLVNHLFLRYWNMKNDNNGIEVLKVMSKILNWDEDMQRKVGLTKSGGFWSAILRPAAADDLPVTLNQDTAISDLWVNFLERQANVTPKAASSMDSISSDQAAPPGHTVK